jgi:hypothetical protein
VPVRVANNKHIPQKTATPERIEIGEREMFSLEQPNARKSRMIIPSPNETANLSNYTKILLFPKTARSKKYPGKNKTAAIER